MSRFEALSGRQRAAAVATVVVVVVVVLAALAEGFVRVRHWRKYGDLWGIESTYTIDPTTNLRIPIPGSSFGSITINSLGFRSPEIPATKPAGTLRVAFLGESTTYCAEVSSNEAAWPHLVWQSLTDAWPSTTVDYVNAGIPGYGVADSQRNLEGRVAQLDPDVIVIYQGVNDLTYNTFQAASEAGIATARTEEELAWPARYSLLWYLVEKNLRIRFQQLQAADESTKLALDLERVKQPYKEQLLSLVQASQQVADTVVLATLSVRLRREQTPAEQTEGVVTSLYYMPYMSIPGLLDAYDGYNDAIREVAAMTGAVLIESEDLVPGDAENFADSVHFTDTGSRHMADRITAGLLEAPELRALVTTSSGTGSHTSAQ